MLADPPSSGLSPYEISVLQGATLAHTQLIEPTLLSLIPENLRPIAVPVLPRGGLDCILPNHQSLYSHYLRVLVFSLTNNFAGLDGGITRKEAWKFLKSGPLQYLHQFIKANPGPTATELVLQLFRCAIEADDAEATEAFIGEEHAALDLSRASFHIEGKTYAAVEFALWHKVWNVAEVLLRYDATAANSSRQAHILALLDTHGLRSASLGVLRLLMKLFPFLPRLTLTTFAESRQTSHVELLLAVSTQQQRLRWLEEGEFHYSLGYIDSSLIGKVVDLMFTLCDDPDRYSELRRIRTPNLIDVLVSKGESDIARMLLHTKKAHLTADTLTYAIKSGKHELIYHLIGVGAKESAETYPQAIRLQDAALIALFEDRGALLQLKDKNRFLKAFDAACNAEDDRTTQRLLQLDFVEPAWLGQCVKRLAKCQWRGPQRPWNLVLTMLKAGADISSPEDGDSSASLLHGALRIRHRALVQAILDSDVDVRSPEILELAAKWGDVSIVKDLISAGATFSADFCNEEPRYCSALYYAVRAGDRNMVDALLEAGAPQNDDPYRTPLRAAVQNRDRAMVTYLLSRGADPNDSDALLAAISKRRVRLQAANSIPDDDAGNSDPEDFQSGGFDPNVDDYSSYDSDNTDCDSLDYDSDGGPCYGGKCTANMDMVRLLVSSFKNRYPGGKKDYGHCALTKSIDCGAFEVAEYLIKRKIGIDPGECSMTTPLAQAIKVEGGARLHLVRMLLECGIHPNAIVAESMLPNIRALSRKTALLTAIPTKHIPLLQLLINYGASVNFPTGKGIQRTPLQEAAEIGSFEIVQFLLGRGASVNGKPARRCGGTALQLAAIHGHAGIVGLLLQEGADVNAPGALIEGRTALEGAAEHGRLDTVKLLLDAGASIDCDGGKQYRRAMTFAKQNSHQTVFALLELHGC